ncbi:flagellar hook-length control protein FliK [Phenylobacterium sp.]|uniref:flagellar hook-length control protein FliK n=1 Tax=Phenylobacterium sp. TaxID=1871053 RepID=UPI003783D361
MSASPINMLAFAPPAAAPAAGAAAPDAGAVFEALMAALLGETPVEAAPAPAAPAAVTEAEGETEGDEDQPEGEGEGLALEAPAAAMSAAMVTVLAQAQTSPAGPGLPAGDAPAAPATHVAPQAGQPPSVAGEETPAEDVEIEAEAPAPFAGGEALEVAITPKPHVRTPGRPTATPAAATAPPAPDAASADASPPPAANAQAAAKDSSGPTPPAAAQALAHAAAPSRVAQAAQAAPVQAPAARPAEAAPRGDKAAKVEGKVGDRAEAFATAAGPVRGAAPTQTADAVAATDRPQGAELAAAETAEPEAAAAADTPDAVVVAEADAPAASTPATGAHTAPTPVRGSPETVAALSAQILKKLDARTTRFDVELDPLGLGKVDVRVEIGAHGRLTAALSFETPQAAQELKARAGELQRALEQAGFDLSGGMSFDVAGDQGQARQHFAEPSQDNGAAFRGRAFRAALDTAGEADAAPAGRLNLRRGVNAGLDVRI